MEIRTLDNFRDALLTSQPMEFSDALDTIECTQPLARKSFDEEARKELVTALGIAFSKNAERLPLKVFRLAQLDNLMTSVFKTLIAADISSGWNDFISYAFHGHSEFHANNAFILFKQAGDLEMALFVACRSAVDRALEAMPRSVYDVTRDHNNTAVQNKRKLEVTVDELEHLGLKMRSSLLVIYNNHRILLGNLSVAASALEAITTPNE